jgi:hypothetical protein
LERSELSGRWRTLTRERATQCPHQPAPWPRPRDAVGARCAWQAGLLGALLNRTPERSGLSIVDFGQREGVCFCASSRRPGGWRGPVCEVPLPPPARALGLSGTWQL